MRFFSKLMTFNYTHDEFEPGSAQYPTLFFFDQLNLHGKELQNSTKTFDTPGGRLEVANQQYSKVFMITENGIASYAAET